MAINMDSNPQYIVLRDACARLDRAGVQYMVTGSLALCYFAEPRFTRDIDIVVDLEVGEERPFVRLFDPDYYIREEAVRSAIKNKTMFNALHMKMAFKVDFILHKKNVFHHSEFIRRERVDYNGVPLSIISKADLIVAKMHWAKDSFSELQLRDVRNLMATGYDADYVKTWVKTLSLDAIFERAQRHE